MDKKIVLIGGGGHCKSVLDSLLRKQIYDEIVITDNEIPAGTEIMNCKVVGSDDILPSLLEAGFLDAFITVGSIQSTKIRHILFEKARTLGFQMTNVIDPSAVVSEFATLGNGILVGKNAVLNAEVNIADGAIINTSAVIEHESMVGEFSHISVGAKLCGNVRVGDDSFVGAGTVVIQGIKIGNNTIIGAGSTVISDVLSGTTRVGIVK